VRGEWAENALRKDFTPSEAVAIGRELEPRVREMAAARKQQHGGTAPGRQNTGDKKPEVSGDTRDIVGAAVGMAGTTYQAAKAVVAAAEADPETFGAIVGWRGDYLGERSNQPPQKATTAM